MNVTLDATCYKDGPEALLKFVMRACPSCLVSDSIYVSVSGDLMDLVWCTTKYDRSSTTNQKVIESWILSCEMHYQISGKTLPLGKSWRDMIILAPLKGSGHIEGARDLEFTFVTDTMSGLIRPIPVPISILNPELDLKEIPSTGETSAHTTTAPCLDRMQFIDNIRVSRSGKSPTQFCRSWDDVEARDRLSNVNHTFVEYLTSPCIGKLFLDRDMYVGKIQPTICEIDAQSKVVHDHVERLLKSLSTKSVNLSFVVATRHGFCESKGCYKLSFRPFIQGMRIRYTDIPRVIASVGQSEFWDMSVYKASEQLLAAINGCKGQIANVYDSRRLCPEVGFPDPLMYVVQHTQLGWPLLDLPTMEPDVKFIQCHVIAPTNKDSSFLISLMECLAATTADDRKAWISIGMVLKKEGGGDLYYKHWLQFSRKGSKFVNEDDCAKTWAGLRFETSGAAPFTTRVCGMGSLCFFAKRDDPEKYVLALESRKTTSLEHVPKSAKRRVEKRSPASIVPIKSSKRSNTTAMHRITYAINSMTQTDARTDETVRSG